MRRLAILIGLLAVLAGCEEDERSADEAERPRSARSDEGRDQRLGLPKGLDLGAVLDRVERVRGLRFERVPPSGTVSADKLVAFQRRLIAKEYPPTDQRRDREVLVLLGLLERDQDLLEALDAVAEQAVLGFYDPESGRLRLVRGGIRLGPDLTETTLAHELVHALEDQRFGIDKGSGQIDDADSARAALVEGTASAATTDYVDRFRDGDTPAEEAGPEVVEKLSELPTYLLNSFTFSYVDGERFVAALRDDADGSWDPVNRALTDRPPQSTEQVLHPEKYLAGERPGKVELAPGRVLGPGWSRRAGGDFGEFDTSQVISVGGVTPAGAAEGWHAGAYELWRRPGRCSLPCADRRALVVSWDWDTPADEPEFFRALKVKLDAAGERRDRSSWGLGGSAAAVSRSARSTTLVLAPRASLARRLAGRARR